MGLLLVLVLILLLVLLFVVGDVGGIAMLLSGGLVLWVLRGSVLVEDVGGSHELVGDVIQFIILEALGARGPGGFVGVVGGIGVVVVGMIWLGHLVRVFFGVRGGRQDAACKRRCSAVGRFSRIVRDRHTKLYRSLGILLLWYSKESGSDIYML